MSRTLDKCYFKTVLMKIVKEQLFIFNVYLYNPYLFMLFRI